MKKLNNIACIWFAASLLTFFGIESTINAEDGTTSAWLVINLVAASITMISTAYKLRKDD